MNLRISQRISLSVAVPVTLMLLFAAWLWHAMGTIGESVSLVRDESLAFAMTARDMERSVIQVQQFLSDVSATRAQDGLDDGFKEAEKNRLGFAEGVERFRRMYTAENDQQALRALQSIERSFDTYFRMGVDMAHAYVEGGPSSGNRRMGEFDKASTALQNELTPFIKTQVDEANHAINDADALSRRVRNIALALVTVMLATAFAFGWMLVNSITRPLQQMQQSIDGVGNGDLTVSIPIQARDELGEMAVHLNKTLQGLRASLREVISVANEVAQHAGELAATTGQLTRSTEDQSDAATRMAASVEQITTSIGQVAANAEETHHLSEQALELVGHGGKIVQSAAAEMARISESVVNSATRINSLSERSTEISGFVGVIKEIADQTNLLALNAAIEAARAGETGRGFAVVADEVRKLAERTAVATSEIGKLIDAIRSETAEAVGSMEASSVQAGRGVTFANEADQVFGRISDSTSQATEHVRDIAEAVREQNTTGQDVARNVERIAQMTEENSVATHHVSNSAGQLKELAGRLQAAAAHFRT